MIKTTIREIRGSLGRYLAILAIVMLGVGFYSGLKATKPAMIATENDYLVQQNFYDLRLLSTIGFEKEDVEKLAQLDETADAEGAVSVDALCSFGDGNESVYKIHTVPQNISRVEVTAGRMPKSADECLLDAALYDADKIGLEITVTQNNDADTLEMFQERTFTAVGIVNSPSYINFERGTSSIGDGKITAFLYVPQEAFDCDYLTEIYLTQKQRYDVYTDEYNDYIDTVQEGVEAETETLVQDRYTEIKADAQEKIDDAQAQLAEKMADGQKELNKARKKIKDGEKEIADGEKEIADGEKELADGEKEIAENRNKLADGEKKAADARQEILTKSKELADARNELAAYEKEISENERKLSENSTKLARAEKNLKAEQAQLKKQEAKLETQETQLSSQKKQLAAQAQELKEKETQLDAQEAELNSEKTKLEQAYAAGAAAGDEYEKNLAALQAGLARIQSGRTELAKADSGIQSGLQKVQEGLGRLQSGKKEIRIGKQQLQSAKAEIGKNKKELQKAQEELSKAKQAAADAGVQLENGSRELEAGKTQLAQSLAELADGRARLSDAEAELADGRARLEKARTDLKKGRAELSDAKAEYQDAKAEFESGTADAQEEIDKARAELSDIEQPDYYVLNRNSNIGYACYESDSNIVAAIANVFPAFFFLVAALVCMTTMNRMVEEQRTQIGVLKALGYGNAAIMGKYLFYAGSAALIGAAAGCALGTWLFPKVIWMGYSIMYSMGEIKYLFDIRLAVFSAAAAVFCAMGAAYFSCRYELYSVPADLIRPKAPKSGRRIFLEKVPFIWSRMKFLHKVSVRNVVRYKKRFFMMVLGIGGCTALLVTGFGIKDSVTNIADMQYDEVQIYDIGITFSKKVRKEDMEKLVRQSGGMLSQISCRYEESVDLDFKGRTKTVYLEVPEDADEICTFLNLHTQSGSAIPYPKEGEAVLDAKMAENMGIRQGDEVQLRDNDGRSLTVTVSALCENFVYHYIYISRETYEKELGREPEYQSAFALVKKGTDIHEAAAMLSEQDNILAVSVTRDMRERIASMMESMDYIVFLIIVCAGSLAFIVLYNLTNINITERIREIATIKVLGFYAKETADYVFRENLTLTGIGAVIGLGLGKWLHWFVMYQIHIDLLSFKTIIVPASYLWSLFFTFVFAMFVNGVMYFKLEKINMAESLKSIE